jgi:predicted SprT family Zn-dependent metalloprotease
MSEALESAAPWLTVVNPDVFLTWCAECGEKFRKGAKAQRIDGGYGYRCEQCGQRRSGTAETG